MISKCKECEFGGSMLGFNGGIYSFKKIYKGDDNNIALIDYNEGGVGCRMTQWSEKQDQCLSNNFLNFKTLKMQEEMHEYFWFVPFLSRRQFE